MAAPTFIRASTGSTDSVGAWSHTSAAPGAAGRLLIVQVLQDGTTGSVDVSITSVTNAENLAGTDNVLTVGPTGTIGLGSGGSILEGHIALYIGRSLSTSAMVITGANAGSYDLYVRVYEFDNVSTGTTLATVIENVNAGSWEIIAGTDGTITDVGVTTLGPDRLALNFVGINDDNALAAFTGETGGDWTEAVAEYAESSGTDATIGLQTATITSSGTINGGTTTNSDATDAWGVVGFALIGTTVSGATGNPYPYVAGGYYG